MQKKKKKNREIFRVSPLDLNTFTPPPRFAMKITESTQ